MPFPEDPNAPKPKPQPLLECGHIACPHCEAHNNINAFFCTVCTAPIWADDPRHELYKRRGADINGFRPQGANHFREFEEANDAVQDYERALESTQPLTTMQLIQRKAHSGLGPVTQWLATMHAIRQLPEVPSE